jgi:hypothetical protein
MRAKIKAETILLPPVELRVQFFNDNQKREGGKKERTEKFKPKGNLISESTPL